MRVGQGGGFQGQANLGVGGGLAGFAGGQLGQLGNLGGQFGLQGGNQSQLLITLIRQVVGRPKDWAPQFNPVTGQPLNPLDEEQGDAGNIAQDNNNLGYYPPALALVVKAPSTVHTREFNLPLTGAGMAAPGGEVRLDENGRKINVAPDAQERDPKKIWEAALVKGVNDPGLIIATTDYLASTASSPTWPSSSKPTSGRGSWSNPGCTSRWRSPCARAAAAPRRSSGRRSPPPTCPRWTRSAT